MTALLNTEKLVGQSDAINRINTILQSGKLSHAYLFSGPSGAGKKAIALAMAEAINDIHHLAWVEDPSERSHKSSWRKHPDIHFFFPLTTDFADKPEDPEVMGRLDLLDKDPYDVIDFEDRPSLSAKQESSNKQSFYPISYFRTTIRKACLYRPNEGKKTVVIISRIERMRKESANAFLKLLEEPPPHLVFILTTDHQEQLLPTIISRCQVVRFKPLNVDEIAEGLQRLNGKSATEAKEFARLAGGNFSHTRLYDMQAMTSARDEVLDFLRNAYKQQAIELSGLINHWQKNLSRENQLGLISLIESLVRDLSVVKAKAGKELILNEQQLDALERFVTNLPDARLEEMLNELDQAREFIRQNGNFKIVMSVLSMRFSRLMRGFSPYLDSQHLHQPAFQP